MSKEEIISDVTFRSLIDNIGRVDLEPEKGGDLSSRACGEKLNMN